MTLKSPFYWNAQIYIAGLKFIHAKNFKKRYQYIAEQVGRDKTVLEPACGPAILAHYLKKECKYTGFDINQSFFNYAINKGIDVYLNDALNATQFIPSDVIVLCDSFQHLGKNNEETLLRKSLASAREKIIICDPFKDLYLQFIPEWVPGGQKALEWYFNFIEKDGHNNPNLKNIRLESELEKDMRNGFDILPTKNMKIECIGEDLIATYFI